MLDERPLPLLIDDPDMLDELNELNDGWLSVVVVDNGDRASVEVEVEDDGIVNDDVVNDDDGDVMGSKVEPMGEPMPGMHGCDDAGCPIGDGVVTVGLVTLPIAC